MQRINKSLVFVAFLLGLAVAAWTVEAQEDQEPKRYRFETEVQIIPVPVFVTEEDGTPVEGLSIDDFVVKEEGDIRPIVIFEEVSFQRLNTFRDRMSPLQPSLRRNFLLFFDLSFSSPQGILRARKAALDFVTHQVEPTDLVAVATYSNFSGIKILCSFTDDHRQAERVVETLGLFRATDTVTDRLGFVFDTLLESPEGPGESSTNLEGSGRFQEALLDHLRTLSAGMERSQQERYRNQATTYLEQIAGLNTALGSVSGRKIILFLSQGIDSRYITGTGTTEIGRDIEKFIRGESYLINTEQRFGRIELRGLLMDGLKRAAGSDVVIHTLDVSGLGGEARGEPGRTEGGGQDTLFLMATETGGTFYKNVNDFRKPLQRILKETSAFYLLGFHPRDLQRKGRFRTIDVEVKRPEVRVSARRGYYEPNPKDKLSASERAFQLVEYVSKDILSDDVFFDTLVSVYPGQGSLARVAVFLKFPGKQFVDDERSSDVMQLEIYGYAIDSDGRFVDFFNRTLSFDLKKERDRLRRTGIKYYDLLLARPGPVRLKLIVRDVQTGKIGSFIEDIEVADFTQGELALTPPVFVTAEPDWVVARGLDPDHIEPRRQGLPISYPFRIGDNEFIPAVRPTLRRDLPTHIMIRAFNLKRHPETHQPQTEIKFQWMNAEGKLETLHQVSLVQKPDQPEPNCHQLIFQVKWDEVPNGPALLQLSLTDLVAQKTALVASPYVLTP